MCFLHCINNQGKIIYVFKEKNQYQMKEKEILLHCIMFLNFFCLVMSYEPQT
jgi:hypothetical protein